MQKILAILIVFALCTAMGMKSAARLQSRAKLLSALVLSVRRFMMAMEYEKKPLYRIAQNRAYGQVQALWDAFGAGLAAGKAPADAFAQAMAQADEGVRGFLSLRREERQLLLEFAGTLGGTDLKTQRAGAALLTSRLEELAETAQHENSVKGRVYRTMGRLCGAAVAILML